MEGEMALAKGNMKPAWEIVNGIVSYSERFVSPKPADLTHFTSSTTPLPSVKSPTLRNGRIYGSASCFAGFLASKNTHYSILALSRVSFRHETFSFLKTSD